MKKMIVMAMSLLLLTATLAGCGRRGNVSENENGKITENTGRTEATLPTTTIRPTESTSAPDIHNEPSSTTKNTEGSTADSTSGTSYSETNGTTHTETGSNSEPDTGNGTPGRSRSGIMGGNGRF